MNRRTQVLSVVVFFIISRFLMVLWGIRIHVDYAFMHFHDVELLKNNFWESIFYTHAFTPWINMLVGFTFLFPESMHVFVYQSFFYVMSLGGLFIFYRLLDQLGLKVWIKLFTVLFFSLTPAYIYFEHFLSYTFPSMVLLLVVTYCLIIALQKNSFKSWLIFFSFCVLLCFVRTTFHYIWLISVILGIFLVQKKISKKVIIAAMIPVMILFGWYIKNLILFGFLGASSWAGFNLSFTTTHRLSEAEKSELVEEGVLSDLVLIPIYSGIEEYYGYVDLNEKTGIAVLDKKYKGRNDWKNYNHKEFITLSSLRMKDNLAYMKQFPFRYAKTVVSGVIQHYGPTTRWHPHDKSGSPHIPIRKKIRAWENIYNMILHSLPVRKVGFYVFFVIVFGLFIIKYFIDIVKWKTFDLKEKLMAFITMNVFYVTFLSCLVTFGELARYRFMVEPFLWIMMLVFFTVNCEKLRIGNLFQIRLKN